MVFAIPICPAVEDIVILPHYVGALTSGHADLLLAIDGGFFEVKIVECVAIVLCRVFRSPNKTVLVGVTLDSFE